MSSQSPPCFRASHHASTRALGGHDDAGDVVELVAAVARVEEVESFR